MTMDFCATRSFWKTACAVSCLVAVEAAFAAPTDDALEMTSATGTYLAARIADADKDLGPASEFYRDAYDADPENIFLLERALVLTAAAGDVPTAVRLAGQLVAMAPDSRAAHLVIGVDQLKQRNFAAAIKELEQAGTGVLADLTNGLLIAWAQFGLGEVDKALEQVEALNGEEWYEPFKLLHRAHMLLAAGRTEPAVEALAKAREHDDNAVRIVESYAMALGIAGRRAEAEQVLNDFLERYPDNPLARAALERLKPGATPAPTVAGPLEGAAETLAGIGAAVGQEGGMEVSALYLQMAMHIDPGTGGGLAALSLGNILDASEQSEEAIEAFESIAPDAPFRALGLIRAAGALDRLDRTEEAESAFKEAIARNRDDVQAYIAYGNMLRGREKYAEAAEQYSEAIERLGEPSRGDWTLFYFRGIAYERTKQWQKAEADFEKALELYPDQPLVLNYLGYSWVDMGMNLEPALDMIRKAVELRPNDGYIVDSLGWAYYRLGRYEDAVRELERAVELNPNDPVINDHLGDAYWQVGRTLEAQFQWRHARDFGAKSPELDTILKKIAEGRLIDEKAPVKEKAAAVEGPDPAAGAPARDL